ncbi:MAG: hypothetical protein GX900_07080 [Clostridiaceae bacterium]|nr:hypothetical protein [Clostridiaceae bacterium]
MLHLRMDRKASDNVYLHKDFHNAFNLAIQYLTDNYGEEGVRDYLRYFTRNYYGPLKADLLERGLVAIEEHYRKIYEIEGGDVTIERSDDPEELVITVRVCPAVEHIRKLGSKLAPNYEWSTSLVHETLCEDTPWRAEFSGWDPQTGASIQRFVRR